MVVLTFVLRNFSWRGSTARTPPRAPGAWCRWTRRATERPHHACAPRDHCVSAAGAAGPPFPSSRSREVPTGAKQLRLVLLRLGDVGLQHLGDDRLPRPVPDRGRRGRRRRRTVGCRSWACPSPPGSWFSYVLSASVLLQVLVLPLDRRDRRPHRAQAGDAGRLRVPRRAGHHGAVLRRRRRLAARRRCCSSSPTSASARPPSSTTRGCPTWPGPDERDAVSSRGWAFGYVGGALLLAVHLGLVLSAESLGLTTGEAVRICLATAGLWWGAFTVFTVSRLRNRPVRDGDAVRSRSGFRQLATTLREMRAFPLTLWFLGAYLLFNDGVQTVIALSATYATEELELDQSVLTGAILMVQVVAIAGRAGAGAAGRALRGPAGRAGRARGLDRRAGRGLLPAGGRGRRSSTCWPPSSAWCRAARRRCPGRCSASSSRSARRPSTTASTRSATAAPAGWGRSRSG